MNNYHYKKPKRKINYILLVCLIMTMFNNYLINKEIDIRQEYQLYQIEQQLNKQNQPMLDESIDEEIRLQIEAEME